MTARDIEVALCAYSCSPFFFRRYISVARASWGIESHECDILALSNSGYAHEIEIKISVADLKRDFSKPHAHRSSDNKIRCLWYASPEFLKESLLSQVPEMAGIIVIEERIDQNHIPRRRARIIRKAKPNTKARKFSDNETLQLARLGTMRYWTTTRRDHGGGMMENEVGILPAKKYICRGCFLPCIIEIKMKDFVPTCCVMDTASLRYCPWEPLEENENEHS